jgi:hypothetical protein
MPARNYFPRQAVLGCLREKKPLVSLVAVPAGLTLIRSDVVPHHSTPDVKLMRNQVLGKLTTEEIGASAHEP